MMMHMTMGASVSFMLLFFVCCVFLKSIPEARAEKMLTSVCENKSSYNTNLNTLLSTMSSHTEIKYGFYNLSYGEKADQVNVIGLCRGDVEPEECRSCLNDARGNLTINKCHEKKEEEEKEGILQLEKCMLRYSNRTIFGVMESSPTLYMWNSTNATDMDEFNRVLENLVRSLTERAASGDWRRKYAEGKSWSAPNFESIYGAAQCSPDLSREDCKECLDRVAVSQIPNCCDGKIIGGQVLTPSCNLRFLTSRHPPSSKGTTQASPIVVLVMAVLLLLTLDLVFGYYI